jgi:hypothetical protein
MAVKEFERTETFENTVEFGTFFRRMIPLLVMITIVCAVMIAFILSFARLGALVAWGVAIPVSAGVAVLLYQQKKRQFAATWNKTVLELSPHGAVMRDPNLRIELPWSAVHSIGEAADALDALRVNPMNEAAAAAAGAIAAASMRRTAESLIGAGTLTMSPNAPMLLRTQVEQGDQGRDVHPATGQPLRAIALTHYDPNWRVGRIGQWIRAYRPDLLDPHAQHQQT